MTSLKSPIANLEPTEAFRFYEVDFGEQEENEGLMEQNPINEQDRKEIENNPFGVIEDFRARRDREDLMEKMRKPFLGQKRSCCYRASPFMRILTEQFDASLLLLPGIFYKIGCVSATVQLTLFSLLSAFCAKLMVESTRLQIGNYHMHNREDFESLLGSNRVTLNFLITSAYMAYPVLLVIGSAISITIASAVFDEAINAYADGYGGISRGNKFFVNLLPAIDKDMHPIPDTELIRVSRGYAFCLVLALIYGAILGPRKLSRSSLVPTFALLALFCGIGMQLKD